jgi:DNA-binding response OmpR family regulator
MSLSHPTAESPEISQSMKKRIMVVDDDPSVRVSLKKVLEETGYQVELAADGDEAEVKLTSTPVDLLLLDLNLPKRDGWDVLGLANSQHPLLPVIMITGLFDQLDTTIIPGVSVLLEKPIDVTILLKTIEKLLDETPEERLHRVTGSLRGSPGYLELAKACIGRAARA